MDMAAAGWQAYLAVARAGQGFDGHDLHRAMAVRPQYVTYAGPQYVTYTGPQYVTYTGLYSFLFSWRVTCFLDGVIKKTTSAHTCITHMYSSMRAHTPTYRE